MNVAGITTSNGEGSFLCTRCNQWHENVPLTGVQICSKPLTAYLEQENAVLHEKLRKLEIKLSAEREACAKVAEGYGESEMEMARANPWNIEIGVEAARKRNAAKRIAALIRGRM